MFDTAQLPLVVVCDVEAPELDAVDGAVARAPSSDSRPVAPLDAVVADERVLAAAVWVVALPSCHASTPPSESIAATLNAVAALRALAARGLRLGRGLGGVLPRRAGAWVGEGVRSSMTRT
jgi:hypothetical protein